MTNEAMQLLRQAAAEAGRQRALGRLEIECTHDPVHSGKCNYEIRGLEREAVQDKITRLMQQTEEAEFGGWAEFSNPRIGGDGKWHSSGFVWIVELWK